MSAQLFGVMMGKAYARATNPNTPACCRCKYVLGLEPSDYPPPPLPVTSSKGLAEAMNETFKVGQCTILTRHQSGMDVYKTHSDQPHLNVRADHVCGAFKRGFFVAGKPLATASEEIIRGCLNGLEYDDSPTASDRRVVLQRELQRRKSASPS